MTESSSLDELNKKQALDRILRVDHAGEYGARRIYEGQLAILKRDPLAPTIRHMHEQEMAHLRRFQELLPEYRARPTALSPLWHIMGFALGAGTALLGAKAAMACTIAVEEVIDEHYARQIDYLKENGEGALAEEIDAFRADEVAHRDLGQRSGGEQARFYPFLHGAIKNATRLAIWMSERI
ncbi:MAG TPA: demethoxyubiquinone hydroxylase family protein [Dongiaceae bacterium]|jgi:ubiquinone biosynthesis monooxygenase Coq7|nr:demethoxyubiquinone hydroxylase family protein [Dongiaceae bacterium]